MRRVINILVPLVIMIAGAYSLVASEWTQPPGSGIGYFKASVLCKPDLSIVVPADSPYEVHLGNFYLGTGSYTIDLTSLNKVIKWVLKGPRVDGNNNTLYYYVESINGNYSNTHFTVAAEWSLYWHNNVDEGASGNFQHYDVVLIDQNDPCNNYAEFIVKAMKITVKNTAVHGGTITIPITINASVNI